MDAPTWGWGGLKLRHTKEGVERHPNIGSIHVFSQYLYGRIHLRTLNILLMSSEGSGAGRFICPEPFEVLNFTNL